MLQSVVDGLLESTAEAGQPLSWQEAYNYVSAAKGAQVIIERWEQRHREEKAKAGALQKTTQDQLVQETMPDLNKGLYARDAQIVLDQANSSNKKAQRRGSPPGQEPGEPEQNRLQTEQDKKRSSRAPALPTQVLQLDSANSRVDFTLSSNTHRTQATRT